MLTEADWKWLEERENRICKFCIHCPGYLDTSPCLDWWADICVIDTTLEDFRDAAEFEALVAAKAVKLKADALPCYPNKLCPYKAQQIGSCHACYLRHARLLAEATMERSGHND